MQTNRVTVFIICLFYLIGLGFLLNAMSETIAIDYTESSQGFGNSFTFLGFEFTIGESIFGNIVISIANLPLWINTLFIVIPSILLIYFGIMMWIPTIPSG